MKEGIVVANATLGELRRVAQLPIRVMLTMADAAVNDAAQLAPATSMRQINPRVLEFLYLPNDKMDLVRRIIAESTGIADLEVVPPGLDKLYAHFPQLAGGGAVNSVSVICAREILLAIRNRWVLATTLLLAALSLSLVFLGSAPTGHVGVGALDVVIVSLTSLSIFLVPLIALLIAHDAIVGEAERGTLPLLLSYPVRRWQVMVRKFSEPRPLSSCLLAIIGYGAAAVALAVTGDDFLRQSLVAFMVMVGSSVLLGAVFIAVGYLISTLAPDRGTAAGAAMRVWLLLVLLYDMALLGIL